MWIPRIRQTVRIAGIALFVGVSAALLLSAGSFLGYRTNPVLSGSMEPAIRRGSLLITKDQPAASYKAGDIVAFKMPFHPGVLVVHRLASLYLNVDGVWTAQTKGDANSSGDAWTLSLGNIEGKTVATLPYIGYLVAWMKTSFGFLAFVLLSFFLCVLWEMRWIAETFGRRRDAA